MQYRENVRRAEHKSTRDRWQRHPACDFLLSAGNVDDCKQAVPLLKQLPDLKGCNILGDKAYGAKEIREYLQSQAARYTIPPKVDTKQPWPFDKETYKRRPANKSQGEILEDFRNLSMESEA